MSTDSLTLRLVRYRPWLFLLTCLLWSSVHSVPLIVGLLSRSVFDTLSGSAPAGLGVWSLLGLMAATMSGRVLLMWGGVYAWATTLFTLGGLLRRNALAWTKQPLHEVKLVAEVAQDAAAARLAARIAIGDVPTRAPVARSRPGTSSRARARARRARSPCG